ncbi:hypothetical protein HDU96_005521 [Phlyctochytrium bullatum]|nr:hypothetical protein HDU96_005521 [Phlyctochytrium bullatum]
MVWARLSGLLYDTRRKDLAQQLAEQEGSFSGVEETENWLSDLALERQVAECAGEFPPIYHISYGEELVKMLKSHSIANPWHLRCVKDPPFRAAMKAYVEGRGEKPELWDMSYTAGEWEAAASYGPVENQPPESTSKRKKRGKAAKSKKPIANPSASQANGGDLIAEAVERRRIEHSLRQCLAASSDSIAALRSIGNPRSRAHPDYARLGAVSGPCVVASVYLTIVCLLKCMLLIGWANMLDWCAMRNDPRGRYLLDVSSKERWDMLREIVDGFSTLRDALAETDELSLYEANGSSMLAKFLDSVVVRYWLIRENLDRQDVMTLAAFFCRLESEEVAFLKSAAGVLEELESSNVGSSKSYDQLFDTFT